MCVTVKQQSIQCYCTAVHVTGLSHTVGNTKQKGEGTGYETTCAKGISLKYSFLDNKCYNMLLLCLLLQTQDMLPPQTNNTGDMFSFTYEWADRNTSNQKFVVLLNKEQTYLFCLLVVKFLDVQATLSFPSYSVKSCTWQDAPGVRF